MGFTCKARAVPIPWAAVPTASPRARQSRKPSALNKGVTTMAPKIPVVSTRTAVSVGWPPSRSAMPMATGAVVDLGASDAMTSPPRPKARAVARAEATATSDPAASPARIGSAAAEFARVIEGADRAAIGAMGDTSDTQALVQSIAEAQMAMETAVAIRDRVVEAYQEILRMPV